MKPVRVAITRYLGPRPPRPKYSGASPTGTLLSTVAVIFSGAIRLATLSERNHHGQSQKVYSDPIK